MKRIAIFASGSGTNAERIIKHFAFDPEIEISLVLTNKKDAFVIERAKKLEVPYMVFDRQTFYGSQQLLDMLKNYRIDLVVLAGFLWLVPDYLLEAFHNRILNIHPALLPKHGGKGMYGMKVHQSVIQSGDQESGISIHLVDEEYDHGKVLYQARCKIDKNETPESLAQKVHQLEYEHYPKVISKYLHKL